MAVDASSVNWPTANRALYLVTQQFRYEYPEPIRDLHHRLVVIPPERFGDQRRLRHRVSVGLEGAQLENRHDRFGNVVVDVFAPRVSSAIRFAVKVAVERRAAEPNRLQDGWLADGYLLEPSRLTAADERLRRVADELAASAPWGLESPTATCSSPPDSLLPMSASAAPLTSLRHQRLGASSWPAASTPGCMTR